MDIDTDGPRLAGRDKDPDLMDTSVDSKHDDKSKGKDLLRLGPPQAPALQDTRQILEQPRKEEPREADALPKLSDLIGKISACVSVAH